MAATHTAKRKFSFGIYLLLLISTAFLSSCSSSDESTKLSSVDQEDGKTSLSFSTTENSYPIKWKAYFEDNKITSLYRNGIRIPKNQIHNYEEMVFDKLDEMNDRRLNNEIGDFDNEDYMGSNIDIHINIDKLNEDLSRAAEELGKHKIHIEFDKEEFDRNMEKLKDELDKLKDLDIEIDIDPEKLEEEMKDVDKNLQNLHIEYINFPFDKEKFENSMKEMTEKMRAEQFAINKSIKINMEKFHNKMNSFKKNMKHHSNDMKNLKTNLKRLDLFIKDLKAELVKDSIISNINDDVEINFSETGLEVNETPVPNDVFEKCKSIYKKYFRSDLKGNWNFDTDEFN